MTTKLVIQLTVEELQKVVETSMSNAISKIPPPPKEEDQLLTRSDIARLFGVSFVTVNAWCRKGKLIPHHMNSRVYFLKSEVLHELLKTGNATSKKEITQSRK